MKVILIMVNTLIQEVTSIMVIGMNFIKISIVKNFIIICLVLLSGCVPSFDVSEEDRLYLKELQDSSIKLEWFYYSAAYGDSPDYITIQSDDKLDTLCLASNIAALNLKSDSIVIGFYGRPNNHSRSNTLPKRYNNYKVVLDTNYVLKPTFVRKFYSKVH